MHQPTHVKSVRRVRDLNWNTRSDRQFPASALPDAPARVRRQHRARSRSAAVQHRRGDAVRSPIASDDFFYRNAQGDEVVFVGDGAGVLETQLGHIPFAQGDYLVIPRGILHRYTFTGRRCAAW